MRTYQTGAKEKVKKNKKAVIYAVVLGLTVLVIAAIITLSLVLGNTPPPVDETPDPGHNVEVPPPPVDNKPKFVLPMEEFTVGKNAVLDRLVYNSSMNQWRTHNGMDFLAAEGTVVRSITDGTVLSVEHTQLEASVVTIEHADGLTTIYKGLSADLKVEAGETVKAGDTIGSVAASMPRERSEGPHLHLEVKKDGKLVNPLVYLPDLGDK